MDWSGFGKFGLVGLMMGVLLFMFYQWSVWIMGWIKDRDIQSAKERETWNCIISKHNDALNKIVSNIDEHDKRANERGNYVRQEHKEMLDIAKETLIIAGRINGHKV